MERVFISVCLTVALAGSFAWAIQITESEGEIAEKLIEVAQEEQTMAEWWSQNPEQPGEAPIHIVITLANFNNDVALWGAAVREAKILFPPNADPPGA